MRDTYRLEITVQDGGSPARRAPLDCPLTVHVVDENDNDPKFQQRHYQVRCCTPHRKRGLHS